MAVDRVVLKHVLDFFIVACVTFSPLALLLKATPYERGYFESDESIRLPFKQQTISEELLVGVGFGLIIVTVLMVEGIRARLGIGAGENLVSIKLLPGWVCESYSTVLTFTLGAACQQLLCILTKYVSGRLRPHFYDVCWPVVNEKPVLKDYIQNYTCTKHDQHDLDLILDSRLSFPSEHASFAMYTAIFFICYIQVKGKFRGLRLLRVVCQFAVFLGAWYTGLSRVVDNMHHWSDVAAGFLIGAMFAGWMFFFGRKSKRVNPPAIRRDIEAALPSSPPSSPPPAFTDQNVLTKKKLLPV